MSVLEQTSDAVDWDCQSLKQTDSNKREKVTMKSKLLLIAVGSSLVFASPALRAEDAGGAPPPGHPAHKGPMGEHLLPSTLVEKLNLTEDQKTKIKGIEESFTKTRDEYRASHKSQIDAAQESMKTARESKDKEKMKAAR